MHNLFAIILIIASGAYCDDILKLVHIVYRHGDRTPVNLFPTDTQNGPSTWYNGLGELTPDGMRRHYQLGQWFRQRYTTFLNNSFAQTQIYVRSTDYNRTIMSAMSNLAGLYPPKGVQNWNSQINWQPIPVHAKDKSLDYIGWMDKPCRAVDKLYATEVETSAKVQQLYSNWSSFFSFLSNKTGVDLSTGFKDLNIAADPIQVESWTRPEKMMSWINDTVLEQINELFTLKFQYYYYANHGISRLRGGRVMNRALLCWVYIWILGWDMEIHDTTLLALLRTLQVPVSYLTCPPYAAAIIFEQFLSSSGQWTVKVSYKTDVRVDEGGGDPVQLPIGNCSAPCSLDQFIRRSQPFITEDWYAECGLKQSSAAIWTAPASILSWILFLALVSPSY